MMERRQRSYPGFQTGSSFLLVVFVVVSMVLFGVLSLSGAVGDIHYSTRSFRKTAAYYDAVTQAEHKLQEVDVCIRTDGDVPEGVQAVQAGDAVLYYYDIPVSDGQMLHVEVKAVDPEIYGQYFLVTAFEERNPAGMMEEADPLPLMRFGEEGGLE